MPTLVEKPTIIAAAGTQPKTIAEHVGRVNSRTQDLSVAHMRSPEGWREPGQRPEFDEYTLVLKGCLRVECQSTPSLGATTAAFRTKRFATVVSFGYARAPGGSPGFQRSRRISVARSGVIAPSAASTACSMPAWRAKESGER